MAKHLDIAHLPKIFHAGNEVIDWKSAIGMTVKTTYGEAEITNFAPGRKPTNLTIRFLNTGSVVDCLSSSLRKNLVKDYLAPVVMGKGCLGIGPHRPTKMIGGVKTITYEYQLWKNMIDRCYNPKHPRSKSYAGCTVCEDWLNFQTFCEQLPSVKGYDLWYNWKYGTSSEKIDLDKDGLVEGNRVYSPETTQFISGSINKSMGCKSYRRKEKH